MIAEIEIFAAILRQNGHSLTATRRAVFAALDSKQPLTMHELVERCRDIDRSSVYRSITLFEEIGIARRLYTGWKYQIELSDAFGSHHHHATCSQCGSTTALREDPALESALQHLAKRHEFTLTGHEIELSGLCQNCTLVQGLT